MDLLPHATELSRSLAWTLVHFVWQGLLIGILYHLGRRLCGTIRQQHNLALSTLIVLLLIPVLTFVHLHVNEPAQAQQQTMAAAVAASSAAAAASPAAIAPAFARSFTGPLSAETWTAVITGLWLLGAALAFLALARDLRRLRRAVVDSSAPPPALAAMLSRQIERMAIRRPVRLRLTTSIHSPGVYGLWRPVILLPMALALGLPRDQLETLMAHELAHIRRSDYIGNLLAITARTLFYFHPVVHRVCRDLEATRETLCDDMVIALKLDPLKYARALSTAEAYRQNVPLPLLTATGGVLSQRVYRILNLNEERRRARSGSAPFLLVATLAVTIVLAGHQLSRADRTLVRPELNLPAESIQRALPALLPIDSMALAIRPQVAPPVLPAPPPVLDDIAPLSPLAAATAATAAPAMAAPETTFLSERTDTAFLPAPDVAAPGARIDPVLPSLPEADGDIGNVMRPGPIRSVKPDYPRVTVRQGVEGVVRLQYGIDADGRPVNIRNIDDAVDRRLVEASISALERWRFPAADVDQPDQLLTQEFSFRLDDDSRPCEAATGTRICRRTIR